MPDAETSGFNPSHWATGDGNGADSTARSREKKEANSGRDYSPKQLAAIERIRRCEPTAFYDILEVRVSDADGEIKKAYRRLSLLTHPDKNDHPHAVDAFKMVSRAFGVLGDKEKRQKFDTFGTDPDSRYANSQAQNPFSAFARAAAAGREARPGATAGGAGPGAGGDEAWDDGISPEEMFNRFFGGMGFGGFDAGPRFVFNLRGGPGVRVHQFGGQRPRGRPRVPGDQQGAGGSGMSAFISLLPILIFFVLPMISSLLSGLAIFGGEGYAPAPRFVYDQPAPPYTHGRTTTNLGIRYYVNPADVESLSQGRLAQMDRTAESNLVRHLRGECDAEIAQKERLMREATRFLFGVNQEKMSRAQSFPTPSCSRLHSFGLGR